MKKSIYAALIVFTLMALSACSDDPADPAKPDPNDHTGFYAGNLIIPMTTTIYYALETDEPILGYKFLKKDIYNCSTGKYSRLHYESFSSDGLDTLCLIVVPNGDDKGMYYEVINPNNKFFSYIEKNSTPPSIICFAGKYWTYVDEVEIYKEVNGYYTGVNVHSYSNDELEAIICLGDKDYQFIGIYVPSVSETEFAYAQKGYHVSL
ncbi:MAG: hypothetical protein ACM3U1_08785 [Chloroflexota bacterium]